MSSYDPEDQRLYKDILLNCRDLGGMPLKGGKTFRKGIILRSSALGLIDENAYRTLFSDGIRTVIDLRSEPEVRRYGNPYIDLPGATFHEVSLFVGDPDAEEDPTMEFLRTHHLGDFYCIILEELGDRIVKILRIIRDCEGPILFHCAHGKDRTGVIAALLYLLTGADWEDIVTNYKVSYDYARVFLDPLIEKKDPQMRHTLRSDEINMRILLDHIKKEYDGDIRRYLSRNGMSGQEMDELAAKCTVSDDL